MVKLRQRKPRLKDEKHRRFIASLNCAICDRPDVQCAHIRFQSNGGMGLKPDDTECVPLCIGHHQVQGQIGERLFWGERIEAAKELANALFYHTGKRDQAEVLIERFRKK